MTTSQPPKAFISYSWSSPTHESWVLSLATRLMEDGVEIVLDKWDLKAGHDANRFMEQMVTDKTVTKVLMICDRTYVEKADDRSGGVGTESQIISPQLYDKSAKSQEKFAAITTELDELGNAYVPVFYKGRIYFDFTDADHAESQYDELLRWLLNKPRYVKPQLGSVPASIADPSLVSTMTASKARRAVDAIRQGSATARGALREYLDALVLDLPRHAVEPGEEPFDETIMRATTGLRAYTAELQDCVLAIARFSDDPQLFESVLTGLERVAAFMFRPDGMSSWQNDQFDAYKIFAHELLVSTYAIVLREERFDLAQALINKRFLVKDDNGRFGESSTKDFSIFRQHPESLQRRNQRLSFKKISLHAHILQGWYTGHSLSFDEFMQADFTLYLVSKKNQTTDSHWGGWYPLSLVYAMRRFRPFDIFARAESKAYFSRLAPAIGATSIENYKSYLHTLATSDRLPQFDYDYLPVAMLANYEHLGSVP